MAICTMPAPNSPTMMRVDEPKHRSRSVGYAGSAISLTLALLASDVS